MRLRRRAAAISLVLALAACRGPRPERDVARCTHVTAERHLRGTLVCEDVWTCERPPGGRFDRIGLRRLAACEGASGPVVLYLPGMHMNARVPAGDPRHDLRLYLVDAGFRTWGIDYRTHAVPPEATARDLQALGAWTADVFLDDAAWAASFVRNVDPGPLALAGFSYGAGLAYRLAGRRGEPPTRLIILDGAAGGESGDEDGGAAIDVGGRRLPFAQRQQLLSAVVNDPRGPSPLPGFATAGEALADVLWTAPAFGGQGGLSAARRGVSDVQDVARLLTTYDRWWPRAALRARAGEPANAVPVLAFASTNMGPEWVAQVRQSAERQGGGAAVVRELRGYGHLDVLVGRRAAREVFEPARAFLAQQ